jgi:transaldolase
MITTPVDSPLLRMTQETPTQYWNDSCAVDELAYAVERGATGATSNPSIVLDVMKKEKGHWVPRVHELAAANRTACSTIRGGSRWFAGFVWTERRP